jgi:hypothetical protein
MRTHRRSVLVLGLIASLNSGCGSDSSPQAQPAASSTDAPARAGSTTPAPAVVTVIATDYAFRAPAEIPAGLTTFRLVNQGPSLHHIQLIKLAEGKTADDFFAAMKAGGPFPKWATEAGGPNPPEVGDTALATVPLEPGNYVMLCFVPSADGQPHVMKGMATPLTVTGSGAGNQPEPKADLTMTLVDYSFQLSQPLSAGRHLIRVENAGGQPHEVAIIKLKPGKTPMDFAQWGEKPVGPSPATIHGGVSGIMPGTHAFVDVDLTPGEYGLLCFVPDSKDGKPHFVHGMVQTIKVT